MHVLLDFWRGALGIIYPLKIGGEYMKTIAVYCKLQK